VPSGKTNNELPRSVNLQEYTVLKLPLPILRSVPIYFGVSNGSKLGGGVSELVGISRKSKKTLI
jgi:hypothetical protein